jgi:putative thioredoxin
MKGQVKLAKLNVDENGETAAELSVTAIPAVFAFSKGQVVDKFVGGLPSNQIKLFLQRVVELHNKPQ